MRFRLVIGILGIVLLPLSASAAIVTDFPGTFQAVTEVSNTINGWKESVMQTETLQKTISAVGSAKKGISSMMETINEYKEKIAEYQRMVEEAKADIEAQVAQVKEAVDKGKDAVNQAKEAVDTVKNADKIAKDLANKTINSVKDTATSTLNSVKGTVDSVKDAATDIVDTAKDTVGINNGSTTASSERVTLDETASNPTSDAAAPVAASKASAANIVDTPSAQPTRTAISGGRTPSRASVVAAPVASGSATASFAGTAEGAAVMTQAAPVARAAGQIAPSLPTAEVVAAKDFATENSMAPPILNDVAEKTAEIKADLKPQAEKSLEKAVENTATVQKVGDRVDIKKNLAVETVNKQAAAVKATSAEVKSNLKAVPADLKSKALDVKSSTKELELKQAVPAVKEEKAVRPVRASFKTSSGYGHIHNSQPLAFASQQGGTAKGNLMIVPRDLFIRCQLDYEEAAEKDKLDACLKKLNDIRLSAITEENPKEAIEEAEKDLMNGYAELLAAGYFEALESYNDSVDFYLNQLHPSVEVSNQRAKNVQSAWVLTADVNRLLNDRLNELNKIWARQLLVKSFGTYIDMGITTSEHDGEKKRSTNTNLYGKVIVPTVFVKRCGLDGDNPEVTEDCLKLLAQDYKANAADTEYDNWREEQNLAIQEYASAYGGLAAKKMALVGEDSITIADKTNKGPLSSLNVASDVREQGIEPNNVLANEVAGKMLDAIDIRTSSIILKNIVRLLIDLVPAMDPQTGA